MYFQPKKNTFTPEAKKLGRKENAYPTFRLRKSPGQYPLIYARDPKSWVEIKSLEPNLQPESYS
jgi:hypothetical protein